MINLNLKLIENNTKLIENYQFQNENIIEHISNYVKQNLLIYLIEQKYDIQKEKQYQKSYLINNMYSLFIGSIYPNDDSNNKKYIMFLHIQNLKNKMNYVEIYADFTNKIIDVINIDKKENEEMIKIMDKVKEKIQSIFEEK